MSAGAGKNLFSAFFRSGVFRERFGALPEVPGTSPGRILKGVFNIFRKVPPGSSGGSPGSTKLVFRTSVVFGRVVLLLVGVCRVPPGCCRDPHASQ